MARVTATVMFQQDVTGARLAASTSASMASPTYSDPQDSVNKIARFEITGLSAATKYYIRAETESGLRDDVTGEITTAADGAHSFSFWTASCANSNSTHDIFNAIREALAPDFGIHTGDFQYENETSTDVAVHRQNWLDVFASPSQAALYREVPMLVIWDDHDYGPDAADSTAPGRDAACEAFRSIFPSPDLFIETDPTDAVYYKFERGRAVFLVTDLRSMRDPASDPDGPTKTTMGTAQKAWFKNELENNAGKLIIWVSSLPWAMGEWATHPDERVEIADAIKAAGVVGRFCIIHGDRHFVAIDDGANTDFATGGGAGVPVFCAAPLHRTNTADQGTWSEGIYNDNNNQVGLVEIADAGGDTITVTFTGYGYDSEESGNLAELVSYEWVADVSTE